MGHQVEFSRAEFESKSVHVTDNLIGFFFLIDHPLILQFTTHLGKITFECRAYIILRSIVNILNNFKQL